MTIKTVTLELDAYEKLCTAQRPGESLSDVVRRTTFGPPYRTGADLLEYFCQGGSGLSEEDLDSIKAAHHEGNSPPDDPWA